MKLWSVSFSYRLGLGFHALNNEGADGSNLMQPRRIDVGTKTYDGISGEIIRHQILENFVNLCDGKSIGVLPMSAGLHPDRGPFGIRAAAKQLDGKTALTDRNLYASVRKAIELCAVLDVGGFLAAWKEQRDGDYKAEDSYIKESCADFKEVQPVKRDSCFDVAWLISEEPQSTTITQHSAYRATFERNSRYAQTMRTNVYAGVIRAELYRIGTDDNWYLQPNGHTRLAVTAEEQHRRQIALVEAIANFIVSPTGAKVAAWAPHVFLNEGAVILTSARTAPFVSPIEVKVNDNDQPIRPRVNYQQACTGFDDGRETWGRAFHDAKELLGVTGEIVGILKGNSSGAKAPA